jgi:hypothetical protein
MSYNNATSLPCGPLDVLPEITQLVLLVGRLSGDIGLILFLRVSTH